jgi:cardiolipin synthase
VKVLVDAPGRGANPIKRALSRDLANARWVQILVPYFLPTWRLRRRLTQIPRRGGKLQLILPGKTDVIVSRLAGQSLYRRFLSAGTEI